MEIIAASGTIFIVLAVLLEQNHLGDIYRVRLVGCRVLVARIDPFMIETIEATSGSLIC